MRAARTTVLEKAKRLTRILLLPFFFVFTPFTRHWKQVKNENADGYLKELGFPFMIRKIAVGPMGKSTDIVKQAGDVQVVTTINVKGSWTRKFIIDKKISQANAEGDECETEAWWDGEEKEYPGKMIHKSKLLGFCVGIGFGIRRKLAKRAKAKLRTHILQQQSMRTQSLQKQSPL